MNDYTVVLLETTGIQEYVYASNELAQNIGASEAITQATSLWVFQILDELESKHNVTPNAKGEYVIDPKIGHYKLGTAGLFSDGLDAEVVYSGGGNALVLFRDDAKAEQLVRRLTRQILRDAPGLQIVALREQGEWAKNDLYEQVQNLRPKLAARKDARQHLAPVHGLGVTAACVFTGLPVVARQDDHLVSSVVNAKLNLEAAGKERLHQILPAVAQNKLQFLYNFDLFGQKNDLSYMAVIHIDGNGMGKRISAIGKDQPNADYVKALRAFSALVQIAATTALRQTADAILAEYDPATNQFAGKIEFPTVDGIKQLPFRPIVFGGDDVTFVCDGRLGLPLAVKYLQTFTDQTLTDHQKAYCRGGVAIVKAHFPFSRAYDLAEELCASAKKYIRDSGEDLTALDWHIGITGIIEDLATLREREYTIPNEKDKKQVDKLYLRPYRLSNPEADPLHAWSTFRQVLAEFQDESPNGKWYDKHNKVKQLRDALRQGRDATAQFVDTYNLKLPRIDVRPDMENQGWQGTDCGYFDAIEVIDLLVPLKGI